MKDYQCPKCGRTLQDLADRMCCHLLDLMTVEQIEAMSDLLDDWEAYARSFFRRQSLHWGSCECGWCGKLAGEAADLARGK